MVEPLLKVLNEKQQEFIFSPSKYSAYYGGIRNGKSWAGCAKVLFLCDTFPGNVAVVGRLTYQELIDTTQKDFLSFVKLRNGGTLQPGPYVKRFIEGPPATLWLQNGSEIRFRYADNPDSILGATLGVFYLDQAEFIPEKVYSALEGRLSLWSPARIVACQAEHLRLYGKALKHTPREFGFITGNPAPGWVYKRYKLNPSGQYHMVEASSAANAANLPPDYLESLKATNTKEWVARYLEGNWDVHKGQVYKDYKEEVHGIPKMVIPPHWPRFIGWDHGQVDPTAVVFVGVDEEGNRVVYKEYYHVSSQLSVHADAVKALCVGDPVRRSDDGKGIVVHLDPSTSGRKNEYGRDFKMLYADQGIYGINAINPLGPGIQHIQQLLLPDPTHRFPMWHPKAGQLGSPHLFFVTSELPSLLHEMVMYEWKPTPENKEVNSKEEPVDFLNHALDAVRYALMAIFESALPIKKEVIPSYADWVNTQMMQSMPTPIDDPDW